MSFIFRGLKRLIQTEGEYIQFLDSGTQENEIRTTGLDGRIRKVVLHNSNSGTTSEVEIFTRNEKFYLNSTKQYVMENTIYFIPRIILGFRPDYSVQLSMRFIIKLVSGSNTVEGICNIIENNTNIGKYFREIYEFAIHIYKGGLCEIQKECNKELGVQVLMSYIELFNAERNEGQETCFLNKSILEFWGDKNSWFTKDTKIKNQELDLFERKEQVDICIFRCEFICITCSQHFKSNQELAVHIATHERMVCTLCQYEFSEYGSFLVHTLTFCKRPICSNKCLYCGKVMNDCTCMKAQEKLFKFIYEWVKRNNDNTVFSEDLIHIIFDYYCSQGNKDMIEASDHEEQYLEVNDQDLQERLTNVIPEITIIGDSVIWDGKEEEKFVKLNKHM